MIVSILSGENSAAASSMAGMEQWQYEVTSGGRLWYCIDDKHRTVWLVAATPGHPKVTE